MLFTYDYASYTDMMAMVIIVSDQITVSPVRNMKGLRVGLLTNSSSITWISLNPSQ